MEKKKADQDLPGYLQGWIPSKAVQSQLSAHPDVRAVHGDLLCGHRIYFRGHLMFPDIYDWWMFEMVLRHYAFEP